MCSPARPARRARVRETLAQWASQQRWDPHESAKIAGECHVLLARLRELQVQTAALIEHSRMQIAIARALIQEARCNGMAQDRSNLP